MSDEFSFDPQEGEMLEALIKSPIYAVLKKVLNRHKEQYRYILLTSKDPPTIFETQGRIMGMNIITELPEHMVRVALAKKSQDAKIEAKKKEFEDRKARTLDPSLPPVKRS